MLPTWAAVLVALAGVGGGTWIGKFITGYLERGREPALIAKLTAAANEQIYSSYGELIAQLRQDAALAREEGRAARETAQEATMRAAAAEARAAGAEARAGAAEAALAEMVDLVRRHVPDADSILRDLERLIKPAASRR